MKYIVLCSLTFFIGVFGVTKSQRAVDCTYWNLTSPNCIRVNLKIFCYGEITVNNYSAFKLIDELFLCGYAKPTFDPVIVSKFFPKIKNLQIEYSNFTHITKDFPIMPNLMSINISWTNLGYLRPTLFDKLPKLKFLDLRWNRLDHMESPLILSSEFQDLYLAGNPWNCTGNLRWLIHSDNLRYIVDKDDLLCFDGNFAGKPVLTVIKFQQTLKEECKNPEIANCSCFLSYVRAKENGEGLLPINTVNCSHRNFNNFPSYLPSSTSILYLEYNKITDLGMIREKKFYRHVQDIYVDYNLIESIEILEAGFWLEHFRVFSIRGNKLTRLPVYALRNALERNHNVLKIYLSHNPWRCDCGSIPKFQEFLKNYNSIIPDVFNVTCKYIEGDDLFGRQVLSLKISDVCKLPKEYKIQPMDLLNGILASLIVLVLSKLGFDYYRYRRYGKVPWIVSKMP